MSVMSFEEFKKSREAAAQNTNTKPSGDATNGASTSGTVRPDTKQPMTVTAGHVLSFEEFKNARSQGLDVNALTEERRRTAGTQRVETSLTGERDNGSGLQLGQWGENGSTGPGRHSASSRSSVPTSAVPAERSGSWSDGARRLEEQEQLAGQIAMTDGADYDSVSRYARNRDLYSARPEAYTADNIEEYIDRAYYLSNKSDLTDEDRAEIQEIIDVIEPKTVLQKMFGRGNGDYYNNLFKNDRAQAFAVYQLNNSLVNRLRENGALSAIGSGFAGGAGLSSVGQAAAASVARSAPDSDVAAIMNAAQRGAQRSQAAAQDRGILYGAGEFAGSVALLHGISTVLGPAIGAISKFAPEAAEGIARAMLGGGTTLAASTAIHELGAAASGQISEGQYVADIMTGGFGGMVGGGLSAGIGGSARNFLQNTPWKNAAGQMTTLANSRLAQSVVSGLSGAAFAGGTGAVREISNALNYGEGYEPDTEALAKDLLINFAFAAIETGISFRGQMGSANAGEGTPQGKTYDPQVQEWAKEYFKGCKTEAEIKSRYRQLVKQYHPDLNPEGATVMQRVNMAKEYLDDTVIRTAATEGEKARADRAKARSEGNETAAREAEERLNRSVRLLSEYAGDSDISISDSTREAIEVLGSVLAAPETKATPAVTGTTETAASRTEAAEIPTKATESTSLPGETETPTARPQVSLRETAETETLGKLAEMHSPIMPAQQTEARRQTALEMERTGSDRMSAKELGLAADGEGNRVQASGGDSLIVMPEATWDSEMQLVNAWSSQTIGLPVTYVQGEIMTGSGNSAREIEAGYTGDGILIRADSDRRTVTRIFEEDILEPLRRQTQEGESNGQIETQQGTAQGAAGGSSQEAAQPVSGTGDRGSGETDTAGTGITVGAAAADAGTGRAVSGGDGGRYPGGSAGGSAGQLEPDAGRRGTLTGAEGSGRESAAARIRDDIRRRGTEQLSTRALGVRQGTETPAVYQVEEEMLTPELRDLRYGIQVSTGCSVEYIVGAMEVTGSDGRTHKVNGMFDPATSRILIRIDSNLYTPEQIGRHEQFHALAARDTELVDSVKQRIVERFGREDLKRIIRGYMKMRRGLTKATDEAAVLSRNANEICEEIFADAFGNMNAFGLGASRYGFDTWAVRAERQHLQSQAMRGNRTTRGPPAERYTYGGESAWDGDFTALELAEGLEREGESNETIRQSTGWFRGMDGKWRFEIDDSPMELRRDFRVFLDNQGTERGMQLSNLIYHSNLFNQYPETAGIDVAFDIHKDSDTNGRWMGWHGGEGFISLNEELLEEGREGELLDTLIHELQHAIQDAEGFTRGSNPQYWERRIQEGYDNRTAESRERAQNAETELKRIQTEEPEYYREMAELMNDVPQTPRGEVDWDTLEQITEDPQEWQDWDARRDVLEKKYGDRIFNFIDDYNYATNRMASRRRSAHTLYLDTAGEIEARDVAGRRRMDPESRRAIPPRGADENTVFADERIGQRKRYSADEEDYREYNKPISAADLKALRSINGGKKISVNAFSQKDLQKTQKWAYRYYQQTGEKSPFFRAWFGEWRSRDSSPVAIADISDIDTSKEGLKKAFADLKGDITNLDTGRDDAPGWTIRVSNQGLANTTGHAGTGKLSTRGLGGLQGMIENAVLLDTELHEHHGNNSKTAETDRIAFDHKLYALGRDKNSSIGLYRITVDDIFQGGRIQNDFRFHNLKYIEKVADLPGRLTDGNKARRAESTNSEASTTEYTVADLCRLVKEYDREYNAPAKRTSAIVDEDGRPLVVYHGTDAEFTVFDRTKGRSNMDIQGMFFSPWQEDAEGYGGNVGAYYLNIKNPAPEGVAYRALNMFKGQNNAGIKAREYLEARGYDGVNNSDEEYIAFYPEQIKSATDNIGTFDRENPDIRYSVDEEELEGQLSLDDLTDGELRRSMYSAPVRQRELAVRELQQSVQDYFERLGPESEYYLDPEEIEELTEYNEFGTPMTGDMNEAQEIFDILEELSHDQEGSALQETYELMDRLLPHFGATTDHLWTREEGPFPEFAKWYNERHPSLYYEGYQPGDLFMPNSPRRDYRGTREGYSQYLDRVRQAEENVEKEIKHLQNLLQSGRLTEEDAREARSFMHRLQEGDETFYSADEETETPELRPEESANTSMEQALYGRRGRTWNGTDPVKYTWAVVPLESIVISNNTDGSINPAYPQNLQPRDRTRPESLRQTMALANNLIPERLEENPSIQDGAPLVRRDGAVVSGNGRSLGLTIAYDRGKADGYRSYLQENAAKWGLNPEQIPERAVLIRVADDGLDWEQLARDANVSTIAGKSASEQARADAKNLMRHPEILEGLITNEDGDLNTAENQDFISDFIQNVIPENERNEAHDADGLLTKDGLKRVQHAIFEAAYGDAGLLEKLSERLDNDMKNVTNALLAAAPKVVAYENAVENGTRYDVQARERILEAVRLYTEAKAKGMSVAELTANMDMTGGWNEGSIYIARVLERYKSSGKQLRIFLNSVYDAAEELGDPNQIGFFGEEDEVEKTFENTLEGAIRKYEDASGRQLPRPERWGAGTLEEVGETRGLRGQELDDYYLRDPAERIGQGVDAEPDAGDSGEPAGESGPVEGAGAESTAEDGGSESGRNGRLIPGEADRLRQEPAAAAPAAETETPTQDRFLSPGAQRILEENRRNREKAEKARERNKRSRTKFPDYNPAPEDAGKSFSEIYNEIKSRAAAERAERLKQVSKEEFQGTPALQKIGVKIEGGMGDYRGTMQLRQIEKAAYELKKTIRAREKELSATKKEKQMANGLAAGIYTTADFGPKVRKAVIEELADYYEVERTINDDLVMQRRRDINARLEEQIQAMLPDDPGYKIPKMYVMNHRTPERLCRNIFGDEKGKEVYNTVFRPVAINEAEKIRFVKRQFDDVREIEGRNGTKSELTREEAALVQQVLEGRAAEELVAGMELEDGRQRIIDVAENIVNGGDAADSAREFGLSQQERGFAEQYARWLQTKAIYDSGQFDTVKIDNAVKIYQEKYDQFYDAINDFLVAHGYKPIGFIKGYAPHMQMEEDLNVFAGYLKQLGINEDVTRLPASIAGRTADLKPNKRWNPYFLSRTGDFTDYDICKGFQSYVGYLSDVLYHTDDTMRIRALSRHYRVMGAPEAIRENLEWARHMNSATPEVKREQLQQRGILGRDEAVSDEEVNEAFDSWISEQFESIQDTTKYSNLVMYLDNYANILAGKQSMSDRGGEYDWGRESLTKANRMISAFARTQVAGNLSSAFSQLSQIPMLQAELGNRLILQACRDYANGTLKKTGFAQESDHLTERAGSGALVTDRYEMIMDKLFTPLRMIDGFTATIAVRAKYLQQVEQGKSHEEAMKEADAYAKRVQGSRAKGSKPLAFHSKKAVNQALHLFQLELFNSWEHVSQDIPAEFREIEKEHGKQKAAAALAKVILSYLMAAFLLNRTTEEVYGGTPAPFDLLGLTTNFIASGYGLTTNRYLQTAIDNALEKLGAERLLGTDADERREEFDITEAAEGAWYEAGSDIPYLRNVMGLLGLGDQTLPIPLMGIGEDMKYLLADVKKDIQNGELRGQTAMDLLRIMNQMLPGGRQLTKTEEGLQLMVEGGRYVNDRLYYPVDNSFGNWVKALLFGRSALEESNAYYAGDDRALSVDATDLYKLLTGTGSAENREAYDALQSARNLSDDQTAFLKAYGDGGGDTWLMWQTMQEYKAAANDKTLGSYEKGRQTRAAITNAPALTDEERLALYGVMDKNNAGKVEKLESIMKSGLSWAEAVKAYDAYAEIEANETISKTEQAQRWASWVNRQSYSDGQKETIRDQIKFWGSYAIEETTVDKLAGGGMNPDQVDQLTEILNGLQPEAGSDKVTDLQKYSAIAASGLSIEEQWKAITSVTPDSYTSTLDKIAIMQEKGIAPSIWTESKKAMYAADDAGNDNGSTDQTEARQALDGMDIPDEQKAILWQLTNKSWSWKKNPYDTEVGQEIYAMMHGGETESTSSGSSRRSGSGGSGQRSSGSGGSGRSAAGTGGLTLGSAMGSGSNSGHGPWFESIANGWRFRRYTRAMILAFVRNGYLTQEEADEILAMAQETEETDGSLVLGAADGT